MFKIGQITTNFQKLDTLEMPSCPDSGCSPAQAPDSLCAFKKLDEARSAYGKAFVSGTGSSKPVANTTTKSTYTAKQVEKILKDFLKNDKYKISSFDSVFSNLDKLDYENIETHLKNLKIFMGGPSNFKEKVVQNGYFYSKDGAEAFAVLLEILSTKALNGRISPFHIALSNYKAEDVLILKNRGLLTSANIDNSDRLNKLAKMDDNEFEEYFNRAQESIKKTGFTYEQLRTRLINEVTNIDNSYYAKNFIKSGINEESVVAQLEVLEIIKQYPIKFNSSLCSLLGILDIDNAKYCKSVLLSMMKRADISPGVVIELVARANKDNEKVLIDLIGNQDIPLEKISEYLPEDGEVTKEAVLRNIDNDPFVKTTRAIANLDIDLKPKNVSVEPLDPRNISEDALVLVHLTKYEPENGVILSTRDKLGGSRNSVHFTLNHPVASHRGGDWDNSDYAIIMPFTAAKQANDAGKFIEGMPNDLYTNGSVKIPEGSILVKQNSELENGKVKVSEHPTIKGVKILETALFPHQVVPKVIEKMGYTHCEANGPCGLFSYGKNKGRNIDDAMENFYSWGDFCKTQNIMPTRHTGSAGDIAEKLIEDIGKLAHPNTWVFGENADKGKNYKKSILQAIETIKDWTKKGYFVSYDLDKLKHIVEKSPTPKAALDEIQNKLGFHPTINYDYCYTCSLNHPLEIYREWVLGVDNPDGLKQLLLDEMKYD
ncbi:hypothetical protein IKA15_04455 [bacterium]|nr:hypothetical protein [bacterium]